jgi:L,D-transpeptidase YbiS
VKLPVLVSVGVILLAALVVGWSELYLPVHESLQVDLFRVGSDLYRMRRHTAELKRELPGLEQEIDRLGRSVGRLGEQFASAFSNELYIAVNPASNRLYLRRGQQALLTALISTGTNDTLRSGKRRWVFETPRGMMTVLRKKKDPVWLKPDWAFLETGDTVPPRDSPLRVERGVLGAFMLDLGGGVMIHGTPHEDKLGRSVSHGCIRVGSADLQVLYDSVPVGTKVYIF